MIQAHNDDLDNLFRVSGEYTELLSRMEMITDRLVEAVQNSEFDRLDGILRERENLCAEIAAASSEFNRLTTALREHIVDLDASSKVRLGGLNVALYQLKGLQGSVLKQQESCDKLLTDKLQECKSELTTVRRQRDVHNTYRKPVSTNGSRFLDDKL